MKCPHCDCNHPDGTKFCPNTGKKIELLACQNRECPEYGKQQYPVDAKYCPKCGHKLETHMRITGPSNGHDYIDLGLPSGRKWASCNLGAATPWEIGHYYAWGDSRKLRSFDGSALCDWQDLKYFDGFSPNGTPIFSKYNEKGFGLYNNLELEDDTANVILGGQWRMPSKWEFEELYDECEWELVNNETEVGYRCIGNNGNSIYLPFNRGWEDHRISFDTNNEMYSGLYWTCNNQCRHSSEAIAVEFWTNKYDQNFRNKRVERNWGLCIRPVLDFDIISERVQ